MLPCRRLLRSNEVRLLGGTAARPRYQRRFSAFRSTAPLHLRQELPSQPSSLGVPTPLARQPTADTVPAKPAQRQGRHDEVKPAQDGDDGWELTVGIEIHAQLNTSRKLFSRALTSIDDEPNSHVAIFDAALPGSQPVLQKEVLLPAIRAALALGCEVQTTSRFDRKHYFYRDQPAGYQITQYYEPLALAGKIDLFPHDGIDPLDGEGISVGIKQVQLEQDTAKSTTRGATVLLDFNRVGTPLIEVITLPQLHHPATAAACVRKIHGILKTVGACTLGMEVGGLRADVNVSVRRRDDPIGSGGAHHEYYGVTGMGQRTEIKNLSSYRAIEDAIRAERDRQIRVLEGGGKIEGETRGWTLGSTETMKLRGKEGEVDYRYMPDPDLGPILLSRELLRHLKTTLPTLPDQTLEMLTQDETYNLTIKDAKTLLALDDGDRLDYYIEVVDLVRQHLSQVHDTTNLSIGRTTGNWVLHELGGLLSTTEKSWAENPVSAPALSKIISLLMDRKIAGRNAKQLLQMCFNRDPRQIERIVEEESLWFHEMSTAEYEELAQTVMASHGREVALIREKKKTGKIQFLVGQMVRNAAEGSVDASHAREVLVRLLYSGVS